MSIERHEVGPRMSQAVVHNQTIYIAGQVASDSRPAGTAGQTKEILAKIAALLAAANSDKTNILFATIWLTDMSTFAEMNRIWDAWVTPGSTPARATVVSPQLAAPDHKVQIAEIPAHS